MSDWPLRPLVLVPCIMNLRPKPYLYKVRFASLSWTIFFIFLTTCYRFFKLIYLRDHIIVILINETTFVLLIYDTCNMLLSKMILDFSEQEPQNIATIAFFTELLKLYVAVGAALIAGGFLTPRPLSVLTRFYLASLSSPLPLFPCAPELLLTIIQFKMSISSPCSS